jgi:DNA replication initiation complex subunit (GINS family)
MEYTDVDPSFRARFLEAKFDPDVFMQSILNSTTKCVDSSELLNIKSRMHLISSEAEYDLKENVHRTHKKFIETAKQVTTLDSEMYQLHSLLSNEKQLISTVKDLINVDNKVRFY